MKGERYNRKALTVANRLKEELSPYLLQHADNPVDWRPWNEEALREAEDQDKPIFLSAGYTTCHWCHVMAHESFEDGDIAEILNREYIPVKVDREERPDIDMVYQSACQAITGQGGWPLSVFITPDGRPFYAGTYFPKQAGFGRPGFADLLTQIADKWRNHRDIVNKAADNLTGVIKQAAEETAESQSPIDKSLLMRGYQQLAQSFDSTHGGFGSAPKFPTPHNLNFLLGRYKKEDNPHAFEIVKKTLTAMRFGGIYDQVGFGFHRYSVDEKWLVPHFEKMLYDQALLIMAYAEAFEASSRTLFADTVREIATYVLRDLTSPEGAFYAAEDADSEGEEGLFYIWKHDEIKSVLSPEQAEAFMLHYGITPQGNFENGYSIPHVSTVVENTAEKLGLTTEKLVELLDEARQKLFQHREKRIRPARDDKIIASWNGLMIAALAMAGSILNEPEYVVAASRAADFVMAKMKTENGRLLRTYRPGRTPIPGFLEDYAFMAWGLLEIENASPGKGRLEEAVELTRVMLELFKDEKRGGLYFSGRDNEKLVMSKKELYDGALPSGNSTAAFNLFRLTEMTGDNDFKTEAQNLMKFFSGQAFKYPIAHTHFLRAADFALENELL